MNFLMTRHQSVVIFVVNVYIPAYTKVTILLRSSGGDHFDIMTCIAG